MPNNGIYNTQHVQSTGLRLKSYIWILWYQNDQNRNKHKLDQIATRNIRISLDKGITFSKWRLRRKMCEGRYDTHDKNLPTLAVLGNSPIHNWARHHNIECKWATRWQKNVIYCLSKANTWRLKNISCNRNEPKQCSNRWPRKLSRPMTS